MGTKKRSGKWVKITVVGFLLLIYPVYFCVVQICTKSDDISLFPTSGIWVAEADGYSVKFNLDEQVPDFTLILSDKSISLEKSESGGHGTIIYPTSSVTVLYFISESLDCSDQNYVSFSCSKFRFNEEDFYFCNIHTLEQNNLDVIKNNQTLHFVKQ